MDDCPGLSAAAKSTTGGIATDTDALPYGEFAAYGVPEPVWVDLRDVVRPPTAADPTLVTGVLDLVAGMTGTPKDRLTGEDIVEQRKRRRWIRTVVVGLALHTVVSVTVAYLAVVQYRAAVAGLSSDPRTALQLNEAALRISPGNETQASLIHDLAGARYAGTAARPHGRDGVLPDGRTLVTGHDDQSGFLWNVSDPATPSQIGEPLAVQTGPVAAGAFSPRAHLLATTTDTGVGTASSAILWEVSDPTRPCPVGESLTGPTDSINAVGFSPDGRTLATVGDDHIVILWNLDALNSLLDAPLERACATTRHGLDRSQWTRYISSLAYEESCSSA